MRKLSLVILLVIISGFIVSAQTIRDYMPEGNYTLNNSIPSPKDFLGFEIGDYHVSNDQVFSYMKTLAEKSKRVISREIGRTYEGKPLIFLIISSEKNIQNIENIRSEHLKLTNPLISSELNYKEMPVIMWFGYSVHGNEASGVNASMAVAYYLTAAQGDEIDNILKNSVIIIQPTQNPDGIQKFSNWVNANRSFADVTDQYSREFKEPAPSSRSNHYWFDLNRDWLWVQQPESFYRMQLFMDWQPSLVNDYHEQNGTNGTYFSPGIKNSTNPLIPEMNRKLTEEIATYHSNILNKQGILFFTKEEYDNFYTGKGAAFPDLLGSIGILYEQPSSRGFKQIRNGIELKFSNTIKYQALCTYSAIKAGIDKREELNKYKADFYKESAEMARKGNIKGYIIDFQDNNSIGNELLKILSSHKIDFYHLNHDTRINNYNYTSKSSYILPLQQTEYRVIRTLFDKISNYTDSTFYDITAWTLPLAMNLKYDEVSNPDGLIGEKVEKIKNSYDQPSYSKIGYLFEIKDQYSYSIIYKLQKSGLSLKVCDKPFKIRILDSDYNFNIGTIFIPVSTQTINSESVYSAVRDANSDCTTKILGVTSSMGYDFDLGSSHFKMITTPKIALIVGKGASYGSIGELWHLLDQKYSIPASLIDASALNELDLTNYNTIILNGNFKFSKDVNERLKEWTNNPKNKIIAIDQAYQTINEIGISDIKMIQHINGTLEGIIVKAKIDKMNPLFYGYENNEINLFKIGKIYPLKSDLSQNIPAYYTEDPVVTGFIKPEMRDKLKGIPALITTGKAIYIVDNPNFRSYWFGTSRIFMNAVFFRELIQTPKVSQVQNQ